MQLINAETIETAVSKQVKAEISDGERFGLALFNGAAAQVIFDGTVRILSSVRLKQYTNTILAGTLYCLVLEAELVQHNEEKLGDPTPWSHDEEY